MISRLSGLQGHRSHAAKSTSTVSQAGGCSIALAEQLRFADWFERFTCSLINLRGSRTQCGKELRRRVVGYIHHVVYRSRAPRFARSPFHPRFPYHPLIHRRCVSGFFVRAILDRPPDSSRNRMSRLSDLGLANSTRTPPGSFASHASALASTSFRLRQCKRTCDLVILAEVPQNRQSSVE